MQRKSSSFRKKKPMKQNLVFEVWDSHWLPIRESLLLLSHRNTVLESPQSQDIKV